jgi:hypothetical protein
MSRAAWRAAFCVLRANPTFLATLVMTSATTEFLVSLAFRFGFVRAVPHRMDTALLPPFAVMLAMIFGVGAPAAASMLPSFRQMLSVPLAAREAGALMLVLRVAVPAVALMVAALLRPVLQLAETGAADHVGLSLLVTLGMCAAFPLLPLVPFLPLPAHLSHEADGGAAFGKGGRRIQIVAAAALLLGGPALAMLPFLAWAAAGVPGLAAGPVLGLILLAIAWRRREQLVLESFATRRRPAVRRRPGPRGWRSVAPLLPARLLATACAGVVIAFSAPTSRHAIPGDVAASMVALLSAGAGFLWVAPLFGAMRVLRLLPLRPPTLSGIFFGTLILPQAFCLTCATTAIIALRPDLHLAAGHALCRWLMCCALNAVCLAPMVQAGRRRALFLVTLPLLAVQWGTTNGILLMRIPPPPDGWLLACSAVLMPVSYLWLTRTLRTAPVLAPGIA